MSIPTGFLQNLASQYRPDTAEIQRATEGTPTGDGTPVTWAPLVSVSARLSPVGAGREALGGSGAVQAVSQWRISLPVGTDATEKDRIVILGRTFEINSVGARSYGVELHAYCSEIT